MKNNGSFKNAGSSRAKMWRNILLILGAVALIASYFADIRDPHPGTETQDNRPLIKTGFKHCMPALLVLPTGILFISRMTKEKKLAFDFSGSMRRKANKPMVSKVPNI